MSLFSGLRCRQAIARTSSLSSLKAVGLAPRRRHIASTTTSSPPSHRIPDLEGYLRDQEGVSGDVERFYRYEQNNPFTWVNPELAVAAKEDEQGSSSAIRRSLSGKQIAVKDNLMVEGTRTTCSSRMLQGEL